MYRTKSDKIDRVRTIIDPKTKRTKESEAHNSDINVIMKKFLKSGVSPAMLREDGRYMDANGLDLLQANIIIAEAKTLFEEIPSGIRKEFDNDPARFIDYAQNPENIEQMREWGLAQRITPTPQAETTGTTATPEPIAPAGEVAPVGGSQETATPAT